MFDNDIPVTFIKFASDILGDTNGGLSGSEIIRITVAYAVEYDINLPHPTNPFDAPNKRTALFENLMAFSPSQQYRIIKDLCDHRSHSLQSAPERKDLKIKLVTRYQELGTETANSKINETLVEETRHWLEDYPDSLSLFSQALEKYEHGAFHRNLLDDLRLALEKLLKCIFENQRSLENQIRSVGGHIKSNGGSPQLSNMFVKLIDYYAKYQNAYVKHNDAVIEEEIEFIFEITASFMKHIIRLSER